MAEYFFGITDKGRLRENNEDSFIVEEISNTDLLVACVIDGVGGYTGGEVAAGIAKTVISTHLQQLSGDVIKAIHQSVINANTRIREEKKKDSSNQQMACVLTCAVADIKNNKFYYAHVGDTRLYLLRDQTLVKLSKDHSVVGFLEESGRLSEEEAMKHPRRNEITKALGFEDNIAITKDFIETGSSPFLPGDVLLLCSDGLSDMISSETILSILIKEIDISEKAKQLIDAANDAGGNDNITAVLVQNNNQSIPKVALKPAEKKSSQLKPLLHVVKNTATGNTALNKKRGSNLVMFLALLFSSILIIVLFQKSTHINNKNAGLKRNMPVIVKEIIDPVITAIKDSGRRFTITAPVLKLSKPIQLTKDSFHLFGKGNIIEADSNYKGPAIIIDTASKHIVLDSVVFRNFDKGIVVNKNNVLLKNVRFVNCRVSIDYELNLHDSLITGRLKDSVFIPVSKKIKK